MDKFVLYEKLSKKEQKKRNAQRRGTWHGFCPVSRIVPNGKAFDRNKKQKAAERKSRSYERDYYYALG